jgi:hypothetical protein
MLIHAEFLLGGPQLADPDMVKHFSSNIYEAKRDGGSGSFSSGIVAKESNIATWHLKRRGLGGN